MPVKFWQKIVRFWVFSELSNYYCKYAFMVSQGIFQMMIHEYIVKNQWQKNKNYPSEIMPSHAVKMIKGELGLPDKCPYRWTLYNLNWSCNLHGLGLVGVKSYSPIWPTFDTRAFASYGLRALGYHVTSIVKPGTID